MKICRKCGKEQDESEFRPGHRTCRECNREKQRVDYHDNLPESRERSRKNCRNYRERHPEAYRAYMKAYKASHPQARKSVPYAERRRILLEKVLKRNGLNNGK